MKSEVNCECEICNKKFHRKPSRISKHNYCSRKCMGIDKKETFKGKNNPQYGLKGNLNTSWKSDKRISHGYKLIRCPNHPFKNDDDFVFEHRLVAEKYLLNKENSVEINGIKYLLPKYEVHHKDFNKLNNDVNNLLVLTKSEHRRLHNLINPRKRDINNARFIKNDI